MNVAVFIVIFLSIFGPKLVGIVDFSILGGLIGMLLLCCSSRIEFSRGLAVVVALLTIVVAHSILAVLFAEIEDMQPVLRHLRAFLSTVLLGTFFYNVAMRETLSAERIINILIVVLMINAVVIILSIAAPEIKPFLAGMYGFDKGFRSLRGFGLTAGYDTAGYLSVFGMALSAAAAYYRKRVIYSFYIFVFLSSAVFTSRSAMLFAFSVIASVCVIFLFRGKWSLKVISLAFVAIGSAAVFYYVLPLIMATLGWGVIASAGSEFTSDFAATDLSAWQDAMWVLPKDSLSLMLGTGKVIETSDVGYVELIYMIGMVGLLLVILIYLYMLLETNRLRRLVDCGAWDVEPNVKILLSVLIFVILAIYVINIKNLYFLTRGFHELTVILFSFILGLRIADQRRRLGHAVS